MRAPSLIKFSATVAASACALAISLGAAKADTFNFTSCEISNGCGTATNFGTVTLTQSGTSVNVNVVLTSGNIFASTGAGNNFLFVFNDALTGSAVTNAIATINGVDQTSPALVGVTNTTIALTAGGVGT